MDPSSSSSSSKLSRLSLLLFLSKYPSHSKARECRYNLSALGRAKCEANDEGALKQSGLVPSGGEILRIVNLPSWRPAATSAQTSSRRRRRTWPRHRLDLDMSLPGARSGCLHAADAPRGYRSLAAHRAIEERSRPVPHSIRGCRVGVGGSALQRRT